MYPRKTHPLENKVLTGTSGWVLRDVQTREERLEFCLWNCQVIVCFQCRLEQRLTPTRRAKKEESITKTLQHRNKACTVHIELISVSYVREITFTRRKVRLLSLDSLVCSEMTHTRDFVDPTQCCANAHHSGKIIYIDFKWSKTLFFTSTPCSFSIKQRGLVVFQTFKGGIEKEILELFLIK